MPTFKLPLSFAKKGGQSHKLGDDTREYYDQVLRAVAATEPGSLPLDPSFGTKDPTFTKGDPSGLRATIAGYWPEIAIKKIDVGNADKSGRIEIRVDYEVS